LVAYTIVAPDTIRGAFHPSGQTKGNLAPWLIDYSKPFYETMRSPAAEKLHVDFFPVERSDLARWDKERSMALVEMPDGSRLYIHNQYNEADKNYIASQFWERRWSRWAYAGGVVAAWALVPCVVLFILGYSLLGVGRGFKQS
jgi:hypothetical protein